MFYHHIFVNSSIFSSNLGNPAENFTLSSALEGHEYNSTRDEAVMTVSARAKFNGTFSKSNSVPIKSHVTLFCKVWLKKSREHLFNLMLVTFTLPNREHVVPGSCAVDYKRSCKRCKIVMKQVTLSDQGKYRCHAQYLSGTNMMKKYKDINLYVKKDWCPNFKVFCNFSKKCVASSQECQRNFPSPEHIHQSKFKSHNEVRNITPTDFNYSKNNPIEVSTVYVLSITGVMFISFFIFVVILWIKRKRQCLYNEKKKDYSKHDQI